jgi:hypothetical protein
MQAAAKLRLAAAEKTLSKLTQDLPLARSCERQAEASKAAYVQRQQDIEKRATQLAERAPDYAADKRRLDEIKTTRTERDVRMDKHQSLTRAYDQARTEAQTQPMTMAQAIERQPAVAQAREALTRAQNAHKAASQRLQYADAARRSYEAAHPIKAAFGLNDGRGQAAHLAANDYRQTQKQLTQAQENLDRTRETRTTLRGAEYQADNHNAGIEAAKGRANMLSTDLARQAQVHRTDSLAREAERNFERGQQQSKTHERGFGMER